MADPALEPPLFGARQDPLPGLPEAGGRAAHHRQGAQPRPGQIPLMVPVTEDLPEWGLRPSPGAGQLSLGPNQLDLSDIEAPPTQLSFLGDPMPWETPPARKSRRPRSKSGTKQKRVPPGQETLF